MNYAKFGIGEAAPRYTLYRTDYGVCAVMVLNVTIVSALLTLLLLSYFIINYCYHDDVIKWNHFLRNWPFMRGIHRSPVNSPHKGQWRRALMFSLICVWMYDWVNNREAGDLRRYRANYDVIIMIAVMFMSMAIPFWTTDLSLLGVVVFGSKMLLSRDVPSTGTSFRILDWACYYGTPSMSNLHVINYDILQGNSRLCSLLYLWCLVPWINHWLMQVNLLFGNLVSYNSWSVSLT